MQVKFRQTTRNGCVSLSIANIFDDHRFTIGLEDCPGERFADLNKKLQDFGCPILVDPVFLTSQYFKTGKRLTSGQREIFRYPRMTKKVREVTVVPYLMSIANGRGRNQHMVAVIHRLHDGRLCVIDSTKEAVTTFTFDELIKRFHIVSVSVFRLWENPEPGNIVTLDISEMSHIFTLNL